MNNFEILKEKLKRLNIPHTMREVKTEDYSIESHVKELGIKYSEGLSTLIFRINGNEFIAVLRRDDRNINSRALKKALKTDRVSFASEDDLKKLNIEPGLACPLTLNDLGSEYEIRILADKAFLEMDRVIIGSGSKYNPIEMKRQDLEKYLGKLEIVDVTEPNPKRQDILEESSLDSSLKRILTGDRPTGPLHVGHLVGSLQNRVKLQDEYELFYLIADIQALTDNYKNPEKVRANVLQVAQDNLSVGLNPEKSTILIQSMIPEIAELTILFMNLVSHNEILRNPTVKTEINEKGFKESVPFGFVAYPISQAADILFCRSSLVPVGKDQAPMIELADKVGERFNRLYNTKIFQSVKPLFGVEKNLVGTDGDSKMSKSKGNTINLIDNETTVKEKVMKMYTDPNRIKSTDRGNIEGNPVFIYHDYFNENKAEVEDLKERYQTGKVGDVEVKEKLAKAINKTLDPIRERRKLFPLERVNEIVMEGTRKAQREAKITIQMVKEAMKINY